MWRQEFHSCRCDTRGSHGLDSHQPLHLRPGQLERAIRSLLAPRRCTALAAESSRESRSVGAAERGRDIREGSRRRLQQAACFHIPGIIEQGPQRRAAIAQSASRRASSASTVKRYESAVAIGVASHRAPNAPSLAAAPKLTGAPKNDRNKDTLRDRPDANVTCSRRKSGSHKARRTFVPMVSGPGRR